MSQFCLLQLARRVDITAQWTSRSCEEKEVEMTKAKRAVPDGYHTVPPQLPRDNAAKAIDWYKKALGAEEVSRATSPDGKILHAEIRVGNSLIMLNDAMMGGKGPRGFGGSPASLWGYVQEGAGELKRHV